MAIHFTVNYISIQKHNADLYQNMAQAFGSTLRK
jgi:hypothetical protein